MADFAETGGKHGGVGVRVLLALFTLLVIAAVIGFVLKTTQQRQQDNHRKAEQISLYGMQTALEKVGSDPQWKEGFDRVPYDGGWYSVSVRRFSRNDTVLLDLRAEGRLKNATDIQTRTFAWIDSSWVPQ